MTELQIPYPPNFMKCGICGALTQRRAAMQRYCLPCSEEKSAGRIKPARGPRPASVSAHIAKGIEISKGVTRKVITGHRPFDADDGWVAAFKIPFSQAASKNHVWSLGRGGGHVFKRQQSRNYQNIIASKVREATRDFKVFQNKIWIDLFVQKPHHMGDAINVIDVVCDGLKIGLDVDDRWFCIRQVDWEIAKHEPQIFVTVYQNQPFDTQACSHCGRLLRLDSFKKKATARLGVDRVCFDCRTAKPVGAEA